MTYLFLSIPNFCGSSLIHNMLETSPNVAVLDSWFQAKNIDLPEGITEGGYSSAGFTYMGPHSIESNMEHVFRNPAFYNWSLLNEQWEPAWTLSNPTAKVKLQKSPLDVFRVQLMNDYFKNVKWIVMVRNPYIHIESIVRQATYGLEPAQQLNHIVYHAIRSLELNIENIQLLKERCYVMTYEDFCANPKKHADNILKWLPELESLDVDKEFMVKGKQGKIRNDNEEKLQNLKTSYPEIFKEINTHIKTFPNPEKILQREHLPQFKQYEPEEILKYWGYEIIE